MRSFSRRLIIVAAIIMGLAPLTSVTVTGQDYGVTGFDRDDCYETCREDHLVDGNVGRMILIDCLQDCDRAYWKWFNRSTKKQEQEAEQDIDGKK